jgi:hypothetical protein
MFSLKRREVQFFAAAMVWILLFSLGTAASMAMENGVLIVGRFSAEGLEANGVPPGWQRNNLGNNSRIAIEREKEDYFLHILCVNDNIAMGKKISLDIRKYPYLSWRWKASKLPEGGDIRKRETDEQVGQVYVVFPKFPSPVNTRSVGYIWDNQAPVGLAGTSTAYSKMKYVVLQSGVVQLNQWIWETRNVYEDYQKLFQEEPPLLGGVLLYVNTQHSKSSAEIFYADIFFSSSPPESLGKYAKRMIFD